MNKLNMTAIADCYWHRFQHGRDGAEHVKRHLQGTETVLPLSTRLTRKTVTPYPGNQEDICIAEPRVKRKSPRLKLEPVTNPAQEPL